MSKPPRTHICTQYIRNHTWNKRREQKSIKQYIPKLKKDVSKSISEIRIIQQASSLYCLPPLSLNPLALCFIVSHSIRHQPSVLSFHLIHNQSTKSYISGSTNICSTFQYQLSTRLISTKVGKKTASPGQLKQNANLRLKKLYEMKWKCDQICCWH